MNHRESDSLTLMTVKLALGLVLCPVAILGKQVQQMGKKVILNKVSLEKGLTQEVRVLKMFLRKHKVEVVQEQQYSPKILIIIEEWTNNKTNH
jgi:hypothetical protein